MDFSSHHTYSYGFPCARNHALEFVPAVDRSRGMGVCGMEMERKGYHLELPAAVCYNHTRIDLSLCYPVKYS